MQRAAREVAKQGAEEEPRHNDQQIGILSQHNARTTRRRGRPILLRAAGSPQWLAQLRRPQLVAQVEADDQGVRPVPRCHEREALEPLRLVVTPGVPQTLPVEKAAAPPRGGDVVVQDDPDAAPRQGIHGPVKDLQRRQAFSARLACAFPSSGLRYVAAALGLKGPFTALEYLQGSWRSLEALGSLGNPLGRKKGLEGARKAVGRPWKPLGRPWKPFEALGRVWKSSEAHGKAWASAQAPIGLGGRAPICGTSQRTAESGQFRTKMAEFGPSLTHLWPMFVDAGPMLVESGPMLVMFGRRRAHCC